jgi:hypothetical protein
VFRAVERPTYEGLVHQQIAHAVERDGPGDLDDIIRAGTTWTVR